MRWHLKLSKDTPLFVQLHAWAYLPPPVHGEHLPMEGIRQRACHELRQNNVRLLLGACSEELQQHTKS